MPFKINTDKLDQKLANVAKSIRSEGRRVIQETAEQAVKIIVQRTREKGLDKDGKKFEKYSDSYADLKKASGGSSKVNLTSVGRAKSNKDNSLRGNSQGGAMLNHLAVVRSENNGFKAVISVVGAKEKKKLEGHVRGSGRLPVRNVMGFTKAEDKLLVTRASRQMITAIKKEGTK